MTAPRRIQLSRAAGWRLADHSTNYVIVDRRSKFGNPFTLEWVRIEYPDATDHDARIVAVQTFYRWLTDDGYAAAFPANPTKQRAWIIAHLPELAGRDLVCWCPLPGPGQPDWCHAQVLIDLANNPPLSVDAGGAP